MQRRIRYATAFLVLLAALGTGFVLAVLGHGFSARDEPWRIEALIAPRLRALAIPGSARHAPNPVAPSSEALAEARAHFADHCATCHGNDGSGETAIGRNLYPPAPDMRESRTQSLTDGEIFYIIHNGIRFTGMPAFGDGNVEADTASWKLVHFIRHLPRIGVEELRQMKELNPKSPHELAEQRAMEQFLSGGSPPPATTDHHAHEH